MKAFVLRSYGPPDVLELRDVADPVPGPGEVLVRVRATSVNPYDWHLMRGEPRVARLMPGGLGLRRPAVDILGCDMAGEVEELGPGVTDFAVGDNVYGLLVGGGFGERVAVPVDRLAPLPEGLSHEEAAAIPMAGVTALDGLRNAGRLQPGQTVLVNGATGGVGTFAVQLAKAVGAHVVAVCGTHNVDLVKSLGADEIIDYRRDEYPGRVRRYDVVLDNAGARSVSAHLRAMTPNGIFVAVGGPPGRWLSPADRVVKAQLRTRFASQSAALADAVNYKDKRAALLDLNGYVEAGRLRPAIHRRYTFDDLPAAVTYQETGRVPAKVVVTVP
ncbi:NAD(P)-dependent alcohol dehydrogenase [Dactylosporangium sp. AC04546]|uniref:NAD(P)-dependent alcohol dehydrogenase n=1 Tax=Dactylosporangium sp. AC04546 TaxID=2862460 RepID=UPI001EDFBC5E|nr:NAD(P)-dependent alcohol dehydrogenase [Dactylosporangium sp. AC04546]WVK89405.1 NAD(P)-dependent alcohol dehydrogenase [Dactylosporangium sp. AC04546]